MKNTYIFAFVMILSLGVTSFVYADNVTSFEVSLGYGSSNNTEVLKLQNFLFSLGFLKVTPTGAYLSLTQKAVADFQKKEGISPTLGYFGPLTRAVANKKIALNNTSPQPIATITLGPVTDVNPQSASAIVSNTKNINWQTTNYPLGAGININLLRKTSNSPVSFTIIRSLAVDTPNDKQETWIPRSDEKSDDVYIEVTCSSTYQFKSGCKLMSEPIKAN